MKSPTQKMFVAAEAEATKTTRTTRRKPKAQEPATEYKEPAKAEVAAEHHDHDHDHEAPKSFLGDPNMNILDLPSKGILGYPASVEYRDIMVGDEETLSMASLDTYSRTLNAVIKGVLNNCEFYEDLSIADRDYILIWLWANNYTPVKAVRIQCSNQKCKSVNEHRVDLTKLPVSDIKPTTPVPFELKLSKSKMSQVNIRLNTVRDELEVEAYMAANPKSNFAMLMLVASIDTGFPMSLQNKLEWVRDNVTGRELGHIRNFHKYFKFGVSDVIEHKCEKCKEVTKGPLPFQAEDILYPTVSTDFEELLRAE